MGAVSQERLTYSLHQRAFDGNAPLQQASPGNETAVLFLRLSNSSFWDERLPNYGAPFLYKNDSMLEDTTGASVMEKLVSLPGQKVAWILSSKSPTVLEQMYEAIAGLMGPGGSRDRVTMNPIADRRGFSDLSLTVMEQKFTKDPQNWKLIKSKSARTSSNSKSVACGDESFVKNFQSNLHTSSQTIQFYNLQCATNQDRAMLLVVRFPENYDIDVISNIVACRVTDYRKQLLCGQVYECGDCNKFIRLTTPENTQWSKVRNGSLNGKSSQLWKCTCSHVGRKCSK